MPVTRSVALGFLGGGRPIVGGSIQSAVNERFAPD